MEEIYLTSGHVVTKDEYVKRKTKSLNDVGYVLLHSTTVNEQVEKILAGANESELSIIGLYCLDDIDTEAIDKEL